ncbi:MAG: DUF2786 domain-containing protein [Xanthomonadales bacterium]|nr:DUF2786 domain-containing protein [Xanthomonadales bacterium]
MSGRDDVIERIQKLLRLAKSSNPHEAALAADKARELMLEYDLQATDLAEIKTSVDRQTVGRRRSRIAKYEQQLFDAVARQFDCRALYVSFEAVSHMKWNSFRTVRRCEMTIIGRRADIEIARYSFEFLLRQVAALAKEYRARRPRVARKTMDSYRLGVVFRIIGSLDRLKRIDESQWTEPGTALVLCKKTAIDDYLKRMGINVRYDKKMRKPRISTAMQDGYRDGDAIEINPAMNAADDRRAIAAGGR